MASKTEKDFWVEMSIMELSTQAHFAGIASSNFERKAAMTTDAVFSSIHSFLSHCALISKLLKGTYHESQPKSEEDLCPSIGSVLGVEATSVIHKRTFRNNIEHYDRELKKWIRRFGVNVMVGTYNIGPPSALSVPNLIYVSHFDPNTQIFTFVNKTIDLGVLSTEAERIKGLSDDWISKWRGHMITSPYL